MGRKKKYQTEEERLEAKRIREAEYYQANKLKRSLYYKERYKKLNKADILKKNKERYHKNKGWDEDHALDMVMNDMVSDWDETINDGLNDLDTDDITFEAFDDDTSGDYEGIIT